MVLSFKQDTNNHNSNNNNKIIINNMHTQQYIGNYDIVLE